MELVVKDNKFVMLIEKQGAKKDVRLYDEIKPAITKIKESIKSGNSSENVELLTIEIKQDKFEIKTIAWDYIATELVKMS